MEVLLFLTSNAVHVYTLYYFLSMILGKSRLPQNRLRQVYLAFYVLFCLLSALVQTRALTLLIGIVPVYLLASHYSSSRKSRILCTLADFAAGILTEQAAYAVFGAAAAVSCGLLQDISLLVMVYLFKLLYCRRWHLPLRSPYSFCLLITSAGTGAVGMLTVNEPGLHDEIVAFVLLLVNLLNFVCVSMLEQSNLETVLRLRQNESTCRAYRKQVQILTESQQKLRFVRHDLNGHLIRLREMVRCGDRAELTAYLDEMSHAVDAPEIYARTGNPDVDCLINYELGLAAAIGTEIRCEVELPASLQVAPFDMTVILGNLLENALDALRCTEEKWLEVSVRYRRGVISVDITNTCDPDCRKPNDGREHGLGLLSVRNALKKYHGTIRLFPDANEYRAAVTFFDIAFTQSCAVLDEAV